MSNESHIAQRLASLSPAKRALVEQQIQERKEHLLNSAALREEARIPGLIYYEKKQDRPLIFWAPSIGEAVRYSECSHLAGLLKEDCSFCTFEPAPKFTEIDSLAEHCVRLMRAEQPHGPYAIIGFCYCSHIAHEMAWQLQREGEQTSLLVIIDGSARDLRPNLRQKYYWLIEGFRGSLGVVVRRIFSAVLRRSAKLIGRGKNEKKRKEDPRSVLHSNAARRHKAHFFRGRLVLFRSAEVLQQDVRRAKYGWDALARMVEAHTVPCRHVEIVTESGVGFVAEKLQPYLKNSGLKCKNLPQYSCATRCS